MATRIGSTYAPSVGFKGPKITGPENHDLIKYDSTNKTSEAFHWIAINVLKWTIVPVRLNRSENIETYDHSLNSFFTKSVKVLTSGAIKSKSFPTAMKLYSSHFPDIIEESVVGTKKRAVTVQDQMDYIRNMFKMDDNIRLSYNLHVVSKAFNFIPGDDVTVQLNEVYVEVQKSILTFTARLNHGILEMLGIKISQACEILDPNDLTTLSLVKFIKCDDVITGVYQIESKLIQALKDFNTYMTNNDIEVIKSKLSKLKSDFPYIL